MIELTIIAVGHVGCEKTLWLKEFKRIMENAGWYVTNPEPTSDSGINGNLPAEFILAQKGFRQ